MFNNSDKNYWILNDNKGRTYMEVKTTSQLAAEVPWAGGGCNKECHSLIIHICYILYAMSFNR